MKPKSLLLFVLVTGMFFSCFPRSKKEKTLVIEKASIFLRPNEKKTGFFATAVTFDSLYSQIEFKTAKGIFQLQNDYTQTCVAGKYDTITNNLLWVIVGGGSGLDMGCNYYADSKNNAFYLLGYHSGTSFFPAFDGTNKVVTVSTRGNTDMFFGKYTYDKGNMLWFKTGGSDTSDVLFTFPDRSGTPQYHRETFLVLDTALGQIGVYANFWGPAEFDGIKINSGPPPARKPSVKIIYDCKTGKVIRVECPTSVP